MISKEAIREERQGCISKEEETFFFFLSQRNQSDYFRKPSNSRRNEISGKTNKSYPHLSDNVLFWLYEKACEENGYKNAHKMTDAEVIFLNSLKEVVERNPIRYRNVEFIPFDGSSKRDLEMQKILLGWRLPDFAVFGLRHSKDYLGVIFEINGKSHEHPDKAEKDAALHKLAKKMGFAVFAIDNQRTGDTNYIEGILHELTPCNTQDSRRQVLRLKRALWTFTVSCHFSLAEIESLVQSEFGITLNLEDELTHLLQFPTCPRRIKHEARINGFIAPSPAAKKPKAQEGA